MEENCRFRVKTVYDMANFKEFTTGYNRTAREQLISKSVVLACTVFILSLFCQLRYAGYLAKWMLILCGTYLIIYLIGQFRNRNGDINYKRSLMANGGTPPVNIQCFGETSVICHNEMNGNISYSYDQVKWLFETEHLLVAVMKLRLCLIIDKRNLQEGSLPECKEFLLSKCANGKRKKIRSCTFGKWLQRVQITVMILCSLISLVNLPGIALFDKLSGKLSNSLSYQEITAELAEIGIQISDQAINEIEEYDANYLKENGKAYYDDNPTASKAADLIYWEATGFYDEETWEWTPSESGFYWFDTEVWNESAIYTDFFTGLSSMHGELAFANVEEDFSGADVETGIGTIIVSFDLDGIHHQLEAEYYYDWFDVNFLRQIGLLLSEDDHANELYYLYDGQALLLYYGTEDTVRELEKLAGLVFFPVTQLEIQ